MDKKKAAAATMAGVIATSGAAIDGAFDSPADILQNNTPEPVVKHIDANGHDDGGAQDDKHNKQAAPGKTTLREKILELPLAVRVMFVLPLWAIGHVVTMACGALITALSPLWSAIVGFLMFALLMLVLFTVGAKMMFPDLPLRKILNRHTIKGVFITSGVLFVTDWAMPLAWPEYTRWKVLVLGGLSLILVLVLLIKFGRKEEKRRAEEREAELARQEEEEGELLYVTSMGKSFTMRRPKVPETE